MINRITGNFWRNGDPKEVVAGIWLDIEKWLEEKYNAHFWDSPDNIEGIVSSIHRYNGLDIRQEKEERLRESIIQDIIKSRADFLRKIERFGYDSIERERNLDGVPLARNIFIDDINLRYIIEGDKWGRIYFPIIPPEPLFLGSRRFYQGFDFSYCESEDKRAEKFLERATNPSYLVVGIEGLGNVGAKLLKQFYRQVRKNLQAGGK